MSMKLTEQLAAKGYIPATKAAEMLRCTIYTIYRRVEAGKLEGARVNGHWYVKESSVKAFEKESSDSAGAKLLASLK